MKEISENIKKEISENIKDDLEDIIEKISKILDKEETIEIRRSNILEEECKDKIKKLTSDDIDKLKDLGKMLNQTSLAAMKTREDHPAHLALYYTAGEYLEKGNIMKGCVNLEKAKKIKKEI